MCKGTQEGGRSPIKKKKKGPQRLPPSALSFVKKRNYKSPNTNYIQKHVLRGGDLRLEHCGLYGCFCPKLGGLLQQSVLHDGEQANMSELSYDGILSYQSFLRHSVLRGTNLCLATITTVKLRLKQNMPLAENSLFLSSIDTGQLEGHLKDCIVILPGHTTQLLLLLHLPSITVTLPENKLKSFNVPILFPEQLSIKGHS